MKKWKRVWLPALSILLAGSLAACGQEQATGGSGGSTEDEVLNKIKETKTLVVGTDATFQPFEFKNEKNEYVGFDIDLIRAVAEELGAEKVEFVDTEFKGLIPGLQGKKFDLIASAMYITDERKKTIDFSDTYYPGGLAIMVKKDNDAIKGMEDLKGKKVSVQIGTKSVNFLKEKYPDVERVEVEKNVEMFLELESGRVEAVVTGRPAAKVYAKNNGTVTVLDEELTEEHYGYGIRKENKAFTEAVNKALQTLKENGKYQEIVEKWFGA
ncbi:transporter substrate-binding domain-containing protein [Brevibacillus humidisoli]|uniref:transporter substrate-binding domain-containing protein n=1 Tax=Brevibacillus humidisoli TaxID=2895522 RepID=UPI001E512903|nr:transporter substrate-binding domain-containing protein [Brevibacillus humidisoli]UFJ42487.1 transporter substrate-binding domain-containing protein [Brevibacillus humidisoli]